MSTETRGQLVTFVCDGETCPNKIEIAGDFRDAWEAAKEDGWRCFKNGRGDWEHRCPECNTRNY